MINFIIVSKGNERKVHKKINAEELKKIISIKNNNVWIDIQKPNKRDLNFMKTVFRFHDLALEDCTEPDLRSKIEEYDSHFFISIHPIIYSNKIIIRDLKVFLGKNYIVTVHLKSIKNIATMKKSLLESDSGKINPDLVLHMLTDNIVDTYFPVLEKIEDDIENVEDSLFKGVEEKNLNKIFEIKTSLLAIRKAIIPQEKIYQQLIMKESDIIGSETRLYFRDVHDHIQKIINNINNYQENIKGDLDMFMSLISYKTNKVIKVLTVISTILMPLTFITGLYGMNFRYMPELEWRYGYFAILGFMLLVSMTMIFFLKKKKWL